MTKNYSKSEVYEMLKISGSLIQSIENFWRGSADSKPNQSSRDKIARYIINTLIPQYTMRVPEELRTIDLNRLEEICKEAMI